MTETAEATEARVKWEVRPTSRAELREDPSLFPWTVTRNGESMGTFHTQAEAVAFAVTTARSAWVTQGRPATLKIKRGRTGVNGRRGSIRDERTYGRDPPKPRG